MKQVYMSTSVDGTPGLFKGKWRFATLTDEEHRWLRAQSFDDAAEYVRRHFHVRLTLHPNGCDPWLSEPIDWLAYEEYVNASQHTG